MKKHSREICWVSPGQSVTSRLETSQYRDFSQFFESIGLGLENFGLEKKSRYRSRKFWSREKVSVSVLMKFFGLVTQWCATTISPILFNSITVYLRPTRVSTMQPCFASSTEVVLLER